MKLVLLLSGETVLLIDTVDVLLFVIVGVLVDDIVDVFELVVLDVCDTDTVGVLELVVLDVCETETVDVFEFDELSDIEPDIVDKSEDVPETLGVSLFVTVILEVSDGDGVILDESDVLPEEEGELVSVYDIVLIDVVVLVLISETLPEYEFVTDTVLVIPVGKVVGLTVRVPNTVDDTDKVFDIVNFDVIVKLTLAVGVLVLILVTVTVLDNFPVFDGFSVLVKVTEPVDVFDELEDAV